MKHEVLVVGGGIGGLTVAALLAARGVDVCLFERGSQVGGCAANFEKAGYVFENGYGLFAEWQPGGIHDRIFEELPVDAPAVGAHEPSYVVRLPDMTDVRISSNNKQFEAELRAAFPECEDAAIKFYRDINQLNRTLKKALTKVPDLQTADQKRQMAAFFPNLGAAFQIAKASTTRVSAVLTDTSTRFQRFLDLQLRTFAQCTTSNCSHLFAAALLDSSRAMSSIRGGASALAESLAGSVRRSGGKILLDTPVLRLAYDASGSPLGIDLLSGERVEATKSIVSNLTIWDTYGKLVGLGQTPSDVRKQLNSLTAYGAYLIYAEMKDSAVDRLPADHLLAIVESQRDEFDPTSDQITLAVSSLQQEPGKQRAVTIHNFTQVDDWFAFHEDESEHDALDQSTLEKCWQRLHLAIPELGGDIEVIDTATPQTFYRDTRRKLGLVGGMAKLGEPNPPSILTHQTNFPNVLRVGDTCLPGGGIAGVSQSALIVANHLTR
jgi:C-3',4' desaturase CrtD